MSVGGICCWSTTLESTNCLTARLNSCPGYLSFKNTVSSRSHSCEKYDQSQDMQVVPYAMRPILSAAHTYNYVLAKWLDGKLKPLSCNQYMVTDTFEFVNEV